MATAGTMGIIAGGGTLPILVARGVRSAGLRVVCVGLKDQYSDELPDHCDAFGRAGILQFGRWTKLLRRFGAEQAIMVGRVRKARMYQPLSFVNQLPDLRALWLWYRVLRHDRRTRIILAAVADELQQSGVTLIDSTRYIPEHLADEGVMTKTQPSSRHQADTTFGLPLITQLADLDIGQSMTVKDCEVIAAEAMEGTDRMLERTGELCKPGNWTLIKISSPRHDMRFDVPTIGPTTIENVLANRGGCIVVEAGRVILLDKPDLIAQADKAGIPIVGVKLRDYEPEALEASKASRDAASCDAASYDAAGDTGQPE